MASEVIAFQVNLRKNNNRFNKGYGKYYPEADSKEPLNLKECTFRAAYVVASKKKEVNGKTVSYQEKIPVSSYATATFEPQEGGE